MVVPSRIGLFSVFDGGQAVRIQPGPVRRDELEISFREVIQVVVAGRAWAADQEQHPGAVFVDLDDPHVGEVLEVAAHGAPVALQLRVLQDVSRGVRDIRSARVFPVDRECVLHVEARHVGDDFAGRARTQVILVDVARVGAVAARAHVDLPDARRVARELPLARHLLEADLRDARPVLGIVRIAPVNGELGPTAVHVVAKAGRPSSVSQPIVLERP